jgi:phosphohistidine phosphatase
MKHLILMRHATAGSAESDHERPLSPQGRREASRMSAALLALGEVFEPQAVLCSTARRVRETWDELAAGLSDAPEASFEDSLYLATPGQMLGAIQSLPRDVAAALLIGHEPGLSQLTKALAARALPEVEFRARSGMAPATLAALRFDAARWSEVGSDGGELVEYRGPRELADG